MTKAPIEYAKDIIRKKVTIGEECETSVKLARLNNCKTIDDLTLWCEYWLEFPYGETPAVYVRNVIERGAKAWD
jgi:hypothetical protein